MTSRLLFHAKIRAALDLVGPTVAELLGPPSASLVIVDRRDVLPVTDGWRSARLNWRLAVRRCQRSSKSCFIGVEVRGEVRVLALVRVSDGHLHTNLLFLEKAQHGVAGGMALTVIDLVLEAVAAAFGSRWIVVEDPVPGLISYYEGFGYQQRKRRESHKRAMFKAALGQPGDLGDANVEDQN